MTETLVELQPAFILQCRKFRETGLILELFTRDHGIVAVLAKGVRKAKSRTIALLQPFNALLVSYSGKADLKTLIQVELLPETITLRGWGVYCGFYINELVSRFLHKYDPHPEVFDDYLTCLLTMTDTPQQQSNELNLSYPAHPQTSSENVALEIALRIFELNLIQHVGFAVHTQYDVVNRTPIRASAHYFFQVDRGAVEHPQGTVSGKTLQALTHKQFTDLQTLAEAKQIMRSVINFHLNGKPLKTRAIISRIQQKL